MRYQHLGWLLVCGWIGVLPATAHADDLADARKAMQKGDLRAAQIDLRNAVRSDPQNAEAHFWLGKVSLDLGDPVAAEREARAARDRGFDPHQAVPLLAQAMLAQQKYKDLLNDLQPDGKDAVLDASILVARGYAQIALQDDDAAQASFALAETDRAERGGTIAGKRQAASLAWRHRWRTGEDRSRDQCAAEIGRGVAGEGRNIAHEGRHEGRACGA